jgi:hypothetical protein
MVATVMSVCPWKLRDEFSEVGYHCRFPVEQYSVCAVVLVDGIGIRKCITRSNTSKACPG